MFQLHQLSGISLLSSRVSTWNFEFTHKYFPFFCSASRISKNCPPQRPAKTLVFWPDPAHPSAGSRPLFYYCPLLALNPNDFIQVPDVHGADLEKSCPHCLSHRCEEEEIGTVLLYTSGEEIEWFSSSVLLMSNWLFFFLLQPALTSCLRFRARSIFPLPAETNFALSGV